MPEVNSPKINEAMDFTNTIHENFFKYVWLDTEGIGVKLNEYHREPRSPYHITFAGHI